MGYQPQQQTLPIVNLDIPKPVELQGHHWDFAHRCLWWIVSSFGAWTVLICLSVGALVIMSMIFKEQIKKRFGEGIKWLDDIINK